MSLSRKDFIYLAEQVNEMPVMVSKKAVVKMLARFCKKQNAAFDTQKFIDACYPAEAPFGKEAVQ